MKCERARFRLHAFLDDELGEEERDECRRHFRECAECRRELETTLSVMDELETFRAPSVPDHLGERIMERVREEKREVSRAPYWNVAAAAMLLIGVGLGLLIRQPMVSSAPGEDVYVLDPIDSLSEAPGETLVSVYFEFEGEILDEEQPEGDRSP